MVSWGAQLGLPGEHRAGWVGLQRGAEAHPHWIGGPIGARRGGGAREGQAACADQCRLVSGALSADGLRRVEAAAKQAVCSGRKKERMSSVCETDRIPV